MIPTQTFNLRLPANGPTIDGVSEGDVLLWDATAKGWKTGPSPSDWIQDYQIRSRADLVAIVAPVGGVFTLPEGSYGIKALTLDPGETFLVEGRVRLYGAQAIVTSVSTPILDVASTGDLTVDGLYWGGRLRLSGAARCRVTGSVFAAAAGPTLIGNGGDLRAVNSRFSAGAASVAGINAGSHHFSECEFAGESVIASGTAALELHDCPATLLQVIDATNDVLVVGGSYEAVDVQDCQRVRLNGAKIEGGAGSPLAAVRVNPATQAAQVSICGCTLVSSADGVSLENVPAMGSVRIVDCYVDAVNGIRAAGGTFGAGAGGVVSHCLFTATSANALQGFSSTSTRWYVRQSFSNTGFMTETVLK